MGLGKFVGFVYLIKDNLSGDFYIGKKLYKTYGKNNYGLESNWKTYLHSSDSMRSFLGDCSIENLEFHALEQYKTRGGLTYAETWSLCHVEAPTNKNCRSKKLEKIQFRVVENITSRHKQRLGELL